MSKSVEKAANFYTAYLTSDDSSVLLSPAIQSAIDGQLQVLKKQISYKRYIVTEIIPNDRRPTRKQDQLITKPTKDFMDVKSCWSMRTMCRSQQKLMRRHSSP